MHILYGSNLYPPAIGGSQIHLHNLVQTIKRAGNQVSVITLTSRYRNDWLRFSTICAEEKKHYEFEEINVFQIGYSKLTRVRMFPWVLAYYVFMGPSVRKISSYMLSCIERHSSVPSLIHVTRNGREFIARALMDFAHKNDIPFVLTPNHHPRWNIFLYKEYHKIYREADAIFVLTLSEKEILVEKIGVKEERVHITGVGPILSKRFSPEGFRARFDLQERFVLFLGQQYKYKGVKSLIEAAPKVWKKHPEIKFVFIGPHTKDSRKLFREVHDNRVLNLGAVDLETKTAALAACELLCLPSVQESFGGVFVEAWAFRKAVIGGRIGPISCVVDDGQDGLLSSQDSNELAEAISHLLSHPSECQAMGNAGWQKLQAKYTWEKLANKTLSIYEELCS